MSIFGSIMSSIFGNASTPAEAAPAASTAEGTPVGSIPAPATQPPAAAPVQGVDVAAVLTEKAAQNGQSLNWRSSIVDLMKLLGLDSSLEARKELAGELHYTGDTSDSATMNVWLHKQVMQKLAENGGQVPADLKG